jgi:hypothetical protein
MFIRTVVIAALLVSGFVAVPAQARVDVSLDLNYGPPPPRVVVVPPPRYASVWSPGYWAWDGRHYVWIEGRWLQARQGYRWIPERWDERDHHRYRFERGHWERSRNQYQHERTERHGHGHRDND